MRLPEEPDLPPQLNIVPMIDVIFAILTFFIISTLFLTRSEGLPVNLPRAVTSEAQQSNPLVITIDAAGQIVAGQTPISLESLQATVQTLLADRPSRLVVINADEQVSHGRVIEVMDRLRQLEGVQLGIATERDSTQE